LIAGKRRGDSSCGLSEEILKDHLILLGERSIWIEALGDETFHADFQGVLETGVLGIVSGGWLRKPR
jgi:hypothetical protein